MSPLTSRWGNSFACAGPVEVESRPFLTSWGHSDHPTAGSVSVLGRCYTGMTSHEQGAFRRKCIGFVFQELALIAHLTAVENVTLPLLFEGLALKRVEGLGIQLLHEVGLQDRSDHLPAELSYGEQQRVAIARAIVHCPKLLLVDEPTANLDSSSAAEVKRLFRRFKADGTTIVAATHDPNLEVEADRTFRLDQGRLVEEQTMEAGA